SKATLTVALKYHDGRPVIERLERYSRPGLRQYRGKGGLPRVLGGLGVAIVSTPKGVMTDREARRVGEGGEVLCLVA
ncbi:MAG: 30S ribosomal protein S8, partial [Steroidobacteraceae bacterium]